MTRRIRWIAALLALVVLVVGAGCGSSSGGSSGGSSRSSSGGASGGTSTGKVHFAKTKFALHAGLAFGAFHHFVYKPFKRGQFHDPAHHKGELAKAGLASLFAYHELKIAYRDAQSSPTLRKLTAPITSLRNRLHSVGTSLKQGHLDTSGIKSSNGSIANLRKQSPVPIKDRVPAALPSGG